MSGKLRDIAEALFKNKPMKIIIPMSGYGERFRRVGYKIPKSLILVEGIPIINHVINMFSEDDEFIFICNVEDLNNVDYNMREILSKCSKNSTIISIEPHKLGPVHAVLQARELINNDPFIVNYCDFTCYWDWKEFKKFVINTGCKGAIPAYKGFHPHSLGKTNYAYIKNNNLIVEDIQEKKPFTKNKMQEFASSGTYYFSSGKEMIKAFEFIIKNNFQVNGEYYVSLAYKYFIENQMNVLVYPIQHFMQWGTPEDLKDYQNWSSIFDNLCKKKKYDDEFKVKGSSIIPMAGLGKRFSNEGYKKTKPLISVSGKPMVLQAVNDLPESKCTTFVIRKDMKEYKYIKNIIKSNYSNSLVLTLDKVTSGQAITALEGLDYMEKMKGLVTEPLTIGACDNGCIYNSKKLNELMNNSDIDIIVWGKKNHSHAMRNPEMYGWINADANGRIKEVKVKKPISNELKEPIIIGTFTFSKAYEFRKLVNALISKEMKVNQEYYIDSCINLAIEMGLSCFYFEVDSFISWGTPNDFKTFEYWQSCFHKWNWHPYSLEKDSRVDPKAISELNNKYNEFDK